MVALSTIASAYTIAGPAGNIAVGTTTSVSPVTAPSVNNSGNTSHAVFDFSLPVAANVRVGNVTTGSAGSSAVVSSVGTSGNVVLEFTIPRGDTGASGASGVTTGKAIAMAIVFG